VDDQLKMAELSNYQRTK